MKTIHTETGIGAPAARVWRACFRVVPEDVGRCRFEQFETFRGLLVAPVMWMVGDATRQGFEAMNRALKAKAESL